MWQQKEIGTLEITHYINYILEERVIMLIKQNYFNLIKFEDEFYVVSQLERFKVNMVGARIFDLCNGLNTDEEIIRKIMSKFDLTEDKFKQEIEQFLDILKQKNIVYNCE